MSVLALTVQYGAVDLRLSGLNRQLGQNVPTDVLAVEILFSFNNYNFPKIRLILSRKCFSQIGICLS